VQRFGFDAAVVDAAAARPVRNCATAVRSAAVSELPCTDILPFVSELMIDSGVSVRSASGAGTSACPGLWQPAQARANTAAPSGAFVCARATTGTRLATTTDDNTTVRDNLNRAGDRVESGLEKTGDAIERGVEKTGDAMKEAGRDIRDGADRAEDRLDNATTPTTRPANQTTTPPVNNGI